VTAEFHSTASGLLTVVEGAGDSERSYLIDPGVRLFRDLEGVRAAASELSLAVGDQVRYVLGENDRVVLWWAMMPLVPRHTVVLLTKNAVGGPRGTLARASAGAAERPSRLPKDQTELAEAARSAPARGFTRIRHVVSPYDEALTIPLLPVFHRECEYAFPVEKTVQALKAMREIFDEGDLELSLPAEVRFVAQDDLLLSPCNGRPVCYLGASTLLNATEVYERFEPLMKSLGGRPHWGKNFTLTQKEVAQDLYPATYETFRQVRDQYDPKRVFANSMLKELFP
jgi:FAD/FMN-containing dehydrogenase